MRNLILAFDIGTSSCKTVAFTENGHMVASGKGAYSLRFPQKDWVEQDPEDIYRGVLDAYAAMKKQGIEGKDVVAITFSAQIAAQCLVDQNGVPLTNIISWMDSRATAEVKEFENAFTREELVELSGVDMVLTPSYGISKLLWLKNNRPELLKRAYKFVQIKDLIIYRFTGKWVSDQTSLKGFVHAKTLRPINRILDFCGVNADILPEIKQPYEIAGLFQKEVEGLEDIPEGIPVITGWNDMNAAFLSMGAMLKQRIGMDLTGTSEHLGYAKQIQKTAPEEYKGLNRVPYLNEREIFYGVTTSGGQAVEWYVRDYLQKKNVSQYMKEVLGDSVKSIAPVEDAPIFIPYLEGERNPWNNPNASGVFFKIRRKHGQRELLYSVLEGVTFALRAIYDRWPEKPEQIVVSGGASFNAIWNQMKADVMGVPFVRLENTEAGCAGATILAMTAIHPEHSMEEIASSMFRPSEVYMPNREFFERYENRFQQFLVLYRKLFG